MIRQIVVIGASAPFDAPLLGMSQPDRQKRLRQNYKPNPDIMNHPDNIKATGGRRVKLRAVAASSEDAQFIVEEWNRIYADKLLYPLEAKQDKGGDWIVHAVLLLDE